MKKLVKSICLTVSLVTVVGSWPSAHASGIASPTNAVTFRPEEISTREMGLDECLSVAMDQNRRRRVSQYAVSMAEAQHRQALAGYWPQIGVKGGYQRTDEAPDFLFPATRIQTPASVITVPGLGQLPVPAQNVNVPAQDVKVMDPDTFSSSLTATWLLYDGGMRKGYREQSKALIDMMKAESRRTDLEVGDSVRRLYYGAILARQLHELGKNTLAQLETTLSLTENMYKEGSGKVSKADFLDNKVMVESLRAMVAQLEKNEMMSQAALANTIGLSWKSSVKPLDKEIPFSPLSENLDSLVCTAYQFNPDWAKIEAGIRAAEGAVRTARSGHYPKVALTGDLHKWWNDSDYGMATDRNKEGWTAGVGMEIPLFDGFLTRNKVAETKARVEKIKQEQFLLEEGIALQIKDTFLGMIAAQKSFKSTQDAMQASSENRDLNTRAYQNELVETEKVIRAQLMEALMTAQHYKTRYDNVALQSQLNLLVGSEMLKKINGK